MYLSPRQFRSAFASIVEQAGPRATCGIVLFVSALDVDSLCACKCLSRVLKTELIPHKIVPTVGYSDLKAYYSQLDTDTSVVIMIGCGATIDLEEFLEIDRDQDASSAVPSRMIYIVDNHRPWNLDNVYGSTSVTCVDDGDIEESLAEHKQAYEFLINDDEDEEEDENKDPNDHDDDIEEENNEEDEDEDIIGPGRRRKQLSTNARLREQYTDLIESYYSQGTYIRSSCTVQTYAWMSSVGHTSSEGLWLLIVGASSLINGRYPHIRDYLVEILQDETMRQDHATSNGTANGNGASSLASRTGVSVVKSEYSLFLLRHWSIYESMVHSAFMSARLRLWTAEGKRRLHKLLARMGVPLTEAREQWIHTSMDVKRLLATKIVEVGPLYGVHDILRPGFVRKFGFQGSITGSDCADILTAILSDETALADKIMHAKAMREKERDRHEEQRLASSSSPTSAVDNDLMFDNLDMWKNDFWTKNFWKAWDAVDKFDLMELAIARAKEMQQSIVATSALMFEKKLIKNLSAYYLAVVKEGLDLERFQNPLLLARLGVWVGEALAENYPDSLPLIIAALSQEHQSYLVLGMNSLAIRDTNTRDPAKEAEEPLNQFGVVFRQTAEAIHATIKMDAFESSIVQIKKRDLTRFLESLTLNLLASSD